MTSNTKHVHPGRYKTATPWVLALVVGAGLLGIGCDTADQGSNMEFGTESHFLVTCDKDSDCGSELSCLGGRCSKECSADTECETLVATSTCEPTPNESGRSCDVSCGGDVECEAIENATCSSGQCRQAIATQVSGGASDASMASAEPAADTGQGSTEQTGIDSGSTQSTDSGTQPISDEAGGTDPGQSNPTCTQPPEAYEVLGECTVDINCDMFVDECGCGCLPESASNSDAGDAAPPAADAGVDPLGCTVSADCVLATRVDTCCGGCQEAYSLAYVEAEECVYAEQEAATPPDNCSPDNCTQGCPGAACATSVAAVCVQGQCRVATDPVLCTNATCGFAEYCVYFEDTGYTCSVEDCEYDRCHPERCDDVGEPCCDPFPGDTVNYCNNGLQCTVSGCAAPTSADAG